MDRYRESEAGAWKEQAAIDKRNRELRNARIVKAARDNPDMPMALLFERFGSESIVRHALEKAGIRRKED